MREELFRELERHTERITSRLRGATTSSVLNWATHELWVLSTKGIGATGLSSPAKQVFHLHGLVLVTPPVEPRDLDEQAWRSLKEDVEGAYRQYLRMFFPTQEEIARLGNEWAKKREVASYVYLDRSNTFPLLNRAQVLERAHQLCGGFDSVVTAALGLSTAEIMGMSDWVWTNHEERLGAIAMLVQQIEIERENWAKSGESIDQARARIAKGPNADLGRRMAEALALKDVVDEAAMVSAFGAERSAAFKRFFASERGLSTPFRLLGDENPAEARPLIRDEVGRLHCPTPQMVLLAALARLDGTLRASDHEEAYYKNRDKVLASQTAVLLRSFFGGGAVVLDSVYRGTDGRDENDVFAQVSSDCLAVEAKAKRSRMPPRDPDMAFTKIEQDFKHDGGIQGGFNQANALRRYLLAPGSKNLFTKGGKVALTLDSPPSDVIPIVVTWDSWGALATNLTMMLQKDAQDPFPWVVSLDQLQLVLEAFRHEKKEASEFLRFLGERQRIHGHVHTTDELEIVGTFLENDGFPPEFTAEKTVVMLTAESARIFDRIEAEKLGIPIPEDKPIRFWDIGSEIKRLPRPEP